MLLAAADVGRLDSLLPVAFSLKRVLSVVLLVLATSLLHPGPSAVAQQTNPVDRKVINPMTDTPNVNPLTQDQPIRTASCGEAGSKN